MSLIAVEASMKARVKGEGKGERIKNGRRGSEVSGNYRREKEEEDIVMVDGFSIVKSALAEIKHAHSRQGGGAAAVADGEVNMGIKDDMRAAEESKGTGTCDLQTYETFIKHGMRGSGGGAYSNRIPAAAVTP